MNNFEKKALLLKVLNDTNWIVTISEQKSEYKAMIRALPNDLKERIVFK